MFYRHDKCSYNQSNRMKYNIKNQVHESSDETLFFLRVAYRGVAYRGVAYRLQ